MNSKKVYILDYDIISPLGIGKEELRESLVSDYKAEKKITNFFAKGLEVKIAAEISKNLKYLYEGEKKEILNIAKKDRKFELILALYCLMKDRLKFYCEKSDSKRSGVILGIGTDTTYFPFFEKSLSINKNEIKSSENNLHKYFYPYDIHSIFLAEKLKLGAFQKSILTACAASTQAISFGANSIQNNETDIVICGGTDSILNQLAFVSFDKLGALSHRNEELGESCKPFDIERSGTIAGEASGLCVLASEDYVIKNKLSPKFELIGYGNSIDAYKITAPDPTGAGIKLAVKRALKKANISLNEVDYINLHGTGTVLNDEAESNAFSDLFKEFSANVPLGSTKDRHGHAIASAGIQELVVLCTAMEENIIPSTLNLKNPIEDKYFKPIYGKNIQTKLDIGMSCNYAFGGINSVLVIKKQIDEFES